MTRAGLALRSLLRSRLRNALTALGVSVGIMAFVFLRTVIRVWYMRAATAAADRLVVRNKTSLIVPLPIAYKERIASIPGVTQLTYAGWFGGVYKDERNFFPQLYADPQSFFAVYSEFTLSPEALAAWQRDKAGALVGEALATRFGFAPGDIVRLRGSLFPGDWDLNVRGVYTGEDPRAMFLRYDFVDERRTTLQGTVNYFAVRVDDPGRGPEVARAIDALFANSAAETITESERAFQLSFVTMSASILAAIRLVSLVVLGIIMLVVGNTLAMAVRERTAEHGLLRALGFPPRQVAGLLIAEAALLTALGTALGLAAAPTLSHVFGRILAARGVIFPPFTPGIGSLAEAAAIGPLVGMLAAALPAWRAARALPAVALRKVG